MPHHNAASEISLLYIGKEILFMDDHIEYKCTKCERAFGKYTSLSTHMSRTHGIKPDQFYVDYYLNGECPLCKCGCGQKTKYSYALKGFRELLHGHYSRIHNNWGHNPSAARKSVETRRIKSENGELIAWNVGLTKDTDERVRKYGKRVSDAFTDSRKNEYADRMRTGRLDGTIPTLHGADHSQWKGGVSEINVLARARVKLYKEWKYPILIRDGFRCVECGDTHNLHVHHDKEQMCEIVAKHIVDDITPKTFEEKEVIVDAVVDYHINHKVSGITLCGKCHEKCHPSLNFDHR